MQDMIACEGFDLTPAIREHVEGHVAEITEALPKQEKIRTFLTHPGKREFTCLFKVHAWHKEIVAKASDENLYKAVTKACDIMIRRVHDIKEKRVDSRKGAKPYPHEESVAVESDGFFEEEEAVEEAVE